LRISLYCIGRLSGPEAQLARDYAARASAAGQALALAPVEIVEVEARKSGKAAEGEALLARCDAERLIACDEHGAAWTSVGLAERLAEWRDQGVRKLGFAIGGADGLDAAVLSRADAKLAFGPQTWPHALARVMLAEQVYRAVTINAGSPYHRP
jgi:23S rRNA (pseudouridine1915-N3)-methyltransferase